MKDLKQKIAQAELADRVLAAMKDLSQDFDSASIDDIKRLLDWDKFS